MRTQFAFGKRLVHRFAKRYVPSFLGACHFTSLVYHEKISISIGFPLSFWSPFLYDSVEVIVMVKEEIWGISAQRARDFFRSQPDITEEGPDRFRFGACRISLTTLPPGGTGIWAAQRTKLHLEGPDAPVQTVYRRFFLQFLSTGG